MQLAKYMNNFCLHLELQSSSLKGYSHERAFNNRQAKTVSIK